MSSQGPSWDLVAAFQLLLQFHFMQNALLVGTAVALLAGFAGYFVVLRGQSFASHMLSQVGFPGAAGAVVLHGPPVAGLVLFCGGAALGINLLGGRRLGGGRRAESAAVGTVLAFALGLGLFFTRLIPAGSAQATYSFLFGTILGITDRDVLLSVLVAVVVLLSLAVLARPLLFSSVDPDVAQARGVPVRELDLGFLMLLALTVAVAVQLTGTLLIFALLVAPAAAAQRVSSQPFKAVAIAVGLSLLCTWMGLSVAYFTGYPVGFFITTLAFLAYLLVRAAAFVHRNTGQQTHVPMEAV